MIKLSVVLGLMFVLTGTTQKVMAQNEDVSLQSFYDELSPYGTWIKDPQYGYVWRPDVDQDEFRPYYSNGRWAMTEYGNTWVSNYDWGWAPFHYGRWIYNRYNDWVWIPDTVWGPAWVSWRSGGGYYGWAPLGPSISIGINFGRGGYRIPDMCWNFIPYNNIYYNSYPRYYGGRNRVYIQNTIIINNTYVRNNRTYYTGPRAEEVRRATNQNVTVYNINRSNRPGASRIERNNVDIYNPRPSRGGVNNTDAAPRNAIQGNITRGTVGRDQNANNGARPSRGDGDVFQGDRNGRGSGTDNMSTRPSRGSDITPIDRNGNMNGRGSGTDNMSTRPSRGSDMTPIDRNGNTSGRGSANDNMSTRPSRGSADVSNVQPSRGGENRSTPPTEGTRPDIFNRSREANQNQPQRVERGSQEPQQRVERSREVPQQQQPQPQQQRVERPQPVQQAPQQRMERPQPQPQPQRVERTQSAPQRSSGSSSESRGSRAESGGGRPGRGGK